jgi:hypothetical protein
MALTIFGCLFVKKIQNKVYSKFLEITNYCSCENPTSNLFRKLFPAFLKVFPKAPVILKFAPKASHGCTLAKVDQESQGKAEQFDAAFGTIFRTSKCCQSKGKPEQFDAAFGTIFRISKCCQRSKPKLSFI